MIDYSRLHRSQEHFEELGYKRIELPWTVTEAVSQISKPDNAKEWEIVGKNKVLVASGEQGFLYLYLKGFLPKGRYQGTTPCFRDEPFDITHTKYFIKNELIITDEVTQESLIDIVEDCRKFFETELCHKIDILPTDDGYDLMCGTIEVGSYGIRRCKFLKWIYGTGCAEPRMSLIKKQLEI